MTTLLAVAGLLRHLSAMRPLYLAIWGVLGVSCVALLVLMRTRWGRSNTLHRCAILSVLVHVGLACLAMTVKLVVGESGPGSGPPIHVRLVDDVARPGVVMPLGPPPLLAAAPESALAAKSIVDPAPEPKPAEAAKVAKEIVLPAKPVETNMEAPPLLPMPVPPVEKVAKVVEPEEKPEPPKPIAAEAPPKTNPPPELAAAAAAAPAAERQPGPHAVADDANANWSASAKAFGGEDTTTTATSAVPPATSPYAHRNSTERLAWAQEQGGSKATEDAVAAALKWLAGSQSSDGRWDASQFGAGVEMAVLGQNRSGAGADADTGITALALLALMGAGNTPHSGEYQANVASAIDFLIRSQAADGNLGGEAGLYAQMYCHSMATFALAEALAMSGDKRLEPAVRRAVEYSVKAQNPSTGGWRYRVGDTGDTSQLGWQLMALWSAEQAGIPVPPQTWTGAERYLRSVRRGNGGLASYRPDSPASTAMTAEALYCRQLLGDILDGNPDAAAAGEATSQLVGKLPEPSRVNLYYWYYASLALHHQQKESGDAQQAWQAWNTALTNVLLNSQLSDGPNAGSWNADCMWAGYGGRVYTTAVSALCLEVYYRYAPEQNERTASRPRVRRLPR